MRRQSSIVASKAFQMNVDQNKTIIVYNRINSYILMAVLEAVFKNDN